MSDIPSPTPREMEILKVLWERGPCSVRIVQDCLAPREKRDEKAAYNTVQTLLRIMEEKGLVKHRLKGRTFVYTPCFSRDQSAARFLERVFDGAADQLVLSLLRSERIGKAELERMQDMIAEARHRKTPSKPAKSLQPSGDNP